MFELCAFADEAAAGLSEQILALKRNRIRLIELRGVDGENIADMTDQKASMAAARLKDEGISVHSLGSPLGKAGIESDFSSTLYKLERLISLCKIFGASKIRVFSFYVKAGQRKDMYPEAVKRLNALTVRAAESGINLCHENEKGIFGESADDNLSLLKAVPGLRYVFDFANYVQVGQDTKAAFGLLKDRTDYLHIKDALKSGRVVPAGFGDGNIERLLSGFERDAVLSIEPHLEVFGGMEKLERGICPVSEKKYRSSDEAFDTAVSALKNLLGRIGYREAEEGKWTK